MTEINKEHLREIIKRKKLRMSCDNIKCNNYHKVIQNCIFDNINIDKNGVCKYLSEGD